MGVEWLEKTRSLLLTWQTAKVIRIMTMNGLKFRLGRLVT